MANEQIIYLDPEEELTSVRERLEQTQARRIMLVIPPQTKLRSHVGWRLLRSRMRELDKDVLVVSSDRQIRAVAKAAGFRVADSQESSPSDTSRPSNRPVRNDMGGKTSQGSRSQAGPDDRSIRPGQKSNQRDLPWQKAPLASNVTGSTQSPTGETNTGTGAAASSTFEIEDLKFDSTYDLHMEPAPPMHPMASGREDDEIDPWLEDYYVARSIGEAAQGADADSALSTPEIQRPSSSKPGQSSNMPLPGNIEHDPFAYMEDIQPVSMPEQRGSTFIHDIDPGIPDISEVPTDVRQVDISEIPTDVHEVEIEDLGDEGAIIDPHSWDESLLEEPGLHETPGMYGMPLRNSRMGNNMRPTFEDWGDDELLPVPIPIPDQPTHVTPSSPVRSSGATTPPSAGRREPQPIIPPPPQTRNVPVKPTTQQTGKPPLTKGSRPVATPPISRRASLLSNQRYSRIAAIVFSSLVVLVLAALAFLYFGSNATVTIIIPSQSSSLTNIQYVASTNQNIAAQNTIPSQILTYPASVPGQGTATGTVKQGNAVATGTVVFTNKGSQPLDVPTGIVISSGSVLFVTTADALVEPASSNTPPLFVPVQAQNPGDSGNVAANSINIIPPDSITKIVQANQGSSSTQVSAALTVTNPSATTLGGAVSVPAVSDGDVKALAMTLQQQVQQEIKAWLATVVHPKDVQGTVMPDVLGSPTPLPEENLITTPAVGQPAPNSKFTGVLSVKVTVLVIRDAAIQAVGRAQLIAAALHMKPAFVLATQPIVTVTKSVPSKDGTTISITLSAMGHIMQQVSPQDISNMIAGKSVDQAKSIITGQAGINNVVGTPRIEIFPPFLGVMPFRPEQIHVIVQPGPVKGAPNG